MYAIDTSTRSRIAPLLGRVLIVDPNPYMARLVAECLKAFGARSVVIEADHIGAATSAAAMEPTLVVAEALDELDPFLFVRSFRRSSLECRKAPVIVLTALATAASIRSAKDAGAHEFLRKPFSYKDVMRRLDHLSSHPRPWVEKATYIGPDRRSFNGGSPKRRKSDLLEALAERA